LTLHHPMMGASLTFFPPPVTPPPPPNHHRLFSTHKEFQPDMAHCSTSNTCCNRHAPSRHPCHQQPALFLLLTLTDCRSFHAGLLTLFHPWLATNHLHLMARVHYFILKLCFLFFERSSASISDAWRLQAAQSLTLGAAALATRGAGCARPWRL